MTTMQRARFLPLSLVAALVLALVLTVTGARGQDATPAASPTPDLMTEYGPVQANEAYRIAFMQPYPNLTFWQILEQAVKERAAANGVTVDVIALGTGNVSDQVSQMEDAVTQGYDGIIIGTVDAAGIVPGITAANEAGIPVLAVDTAPAGGELISLVQTDNVAASRAAGEFIAAQIGGTGKVLNLQGDMANQTAQARSQGLEEALAEHPDIQLISQSAHWTQEEGLSITENILQSDPDIKAIFAANDPPAFGALQALKAAGRDDVLIVGFDANPDAVQAVKDGEFAADIAQFPAVMGTVGVDLMVRHLNGGTVPATVDSSSAVITPQNVDQFLPQEATPAA